MPAVALFALAFTLFLVGLITSLDHISTSGVRAACAFVACGVGLISSEAMLLQAMHLAGML